MNAPQSLQEWFALSWPQRTRWFLYQLDPQSRGAHNNAFSARIVGALSADALQTALLSLAERHPMLRLRMRSQGGEPLQCVAARAVAPLEVVDARGWDEAALRARIGDAAARPFDLLTQPPLRGHLYQRGDGDAVLLLVFDHIACDGWSYWRLLDELGRLLADPAAAWMLPPSTASYAHYTAQQAQWLGEPAAQAQRAYWERCLAHAPESLQLPRDAVAAVPGAPRQGALTLRVSPATTTALRGLARQHSATLFTTLLSAFHILLHRLTGQTRIAIGSPMPGRNDPAWDDTVGDFVNPVVILADFEQDTTVAALLRQVRGNTLRAMQNSDYPFGRLARERLAPGETSSAALFEAMFVHQQARGAGDLVSLWRGDASTPPVAWGGVHLTSYPVHQSGGDDGLAIVLEALELGDELRCDFKFDARKFGPATMQRLVACFDSLLQDLSADAARPVARLNLMGADERRRMLDDFGTGTAPAATGGTMHGLFAAQAQARPDAPALAQGDAVVTYRELDQRAERIARRLATLGVGAESRVAICLPRSFDVVAALLGVLKAGAAYVPLDVDYPVARLAHMLRDAAPAVVLTCADAAPRLREALPEYAGHVLALDSDAAWLSADAGDARLPDESAAGALAYVIYTSGSTGVPKGVMACHDGLANLARAQIAAFDVRADSRVLQFASLSFDASISEIAMALCSGACLVLASRDELQAGAPLLHTLERQRISHVTLPSAVLALLPADAALQPLHLVVAGDVCPPALVRAWSQRHRVYNAYGPTEATVCATIFACAADHDGPVPIGAPMAGVRIRILDDHDQLVGVGVVGEIHVGGIGVARGYLNLPDASAQRFVRDPFDADPDARLYRTGDLGRWDALGRVEYVGRRDFQMKIRGIRIEAGEVESALLGADGVREALVLGLPDARGDRRLVAYVTARDGHVLSVDALRERLAGTLPAAAVPSAIVVLDGMPLAPTGKVDRRALPAPDFGALSRREYEAPRGTVERHVARVWERLLGIDGVGRNDHFFALGGHSLLAVQVVSALRLELGIDVPVRTLFQSPGLADFAHQLAQARACCEAPIPRAARSGPLALSWAQQRLWFVSQFDRHASAAYHMAGALRLDGMLDVGALRAALDLLAARHETLRTSFPDDGGTPVQRIAPAGTPFALSTRDLRGLASEQRAAAIDEALAEEAARPFDLATGPLIRACLLSLQDDAHILAIAQHHVISDGWSVGVMMRELGELYAACLAGDADPAASLEPLPLQYADFAAWQRDWLQGERLREQTEFWRAQLAGAPTLLELPADRPRPDEQSHAGATLEWTLPAATVDALRALGQRHDCTLFMTLMAGWAVLLGRWSGQNDVVVGTPVANRVRAELEGLIGCFVNTLAIRVRPDPALSVAALLDQVRQVSLDAFGHEDLPFEQVVEALQPARSMAHHPLFQVMLALNNVPQSDALRLPGIEVMALPRVQHTTQFDLSISLTETGHALAVSIEYATDLFDRATIARLMREFEHLLVDMGRDDARPVGLLSAMSAQERQRVLHDFNDTRAPVPEHALVHAPFERIARLAPAREALVCGGETLSYDALNRRANRIAHRLVALGVRPDDRVGLCVTRSVDMIAGMLGILKAGAAYVPLDPTDPPRRLALILGDSRPRALLTQRAVKDCLAQADAMPAMVTLVLDDPLERAQLLACDDADPSSERLGLGPRHLAYLIYTSGSTGQPKGVMVEHRQVTHFMASHVEGAELSSNDRVLQFASCGFDSSVEEIFPTLAVGATLVLRPADLRIPDAAFAALLAEQRITVADLPTAFWHLWCGEIAAGRSLPGLDLRLVVVGGEAAESRHLQAWLASPATAHCRWLNTYGPTETTIHSTRLAIDARDHVPQGAVSIGRPIANTRVYILDAQRQPVPIGREGEIWIAGAGVTRGYLGLDALTAERFVADPFDTRDEGARMYRTGDLGRWREDGCIEYRGRNDFQVKLRGFRIELGEIEAHLADCDGVQAAVVVAAGDGDGGQRLVAYVVPAPGADLDASALRTTLAGELAEYMLPAAFVMLEQLPMTSSGKIDRRALPIPGATAIANRAYEAPHDGVEATLAAIWSALLHVPRVGRHDRFFELGGHSLLAVQLLARIREALGAELSLRDVFAHPDLAGLARAADGARTSTEAEDDATPSRAGRSQPLPLSWAQQRLWFLDQLDPDAGAAYRMGGVVRLRGPLDRAAFGQALNAVAARHEILRTHFDVREGEPSQVVGAPEADFPLAFHDLCGASGQAADATVDAARRAPFDLARGPLARATLVALGPDEHLLALAQHHIVSDGWSTGLFAQELAECYAAALEQREPDLPPLPLQYADYAAWQRRWLAGPAHQRQLAFWTDRLAGVPALLQLPTDRPRPRRQSFAGACFEFTLPAPLTGRLRALSERHGATLFMTLLAGWALLLSRLSGERDVVIGTPVANRPHAHLQSLIGMFVNTLALRIRLDEAGPDVARLLAYVKAQTLSALEHRELPFEQVVEALNPPRNTSHGPIVQVMLLMNNVPVDARLRLEGIEATELPESERAAHYDLSLSIDERGGELRAQFEYASALFDAETIADWAACLRNVLEAMAQDDALALDRIPLLDDARQRELHLAVNPPATPLDEHAAIQHAFEAWAAVKPDAPALVFRGENWSYARLNARANQIAHRLLVLGAREDARVALYLERGPDMLAAVLGVLKAGAAYVPLDPAYPAGRLAHMLGDSAPIAVLTQASLRASLPATPATLLELHDDLAHATPQSLANPGPIAGARRLAYVIYTSGSTGLPKGVMIEHRAVVNFLATMAEAPGIRKTDRVLALTTLSFDIAALELLLPLSNGACVILAGSEAAADPRALQALIAGAGVTLMQATPTTWRMLLADGWTGAPDMTALCGGEALATELASRLQPRVRALWNLYGPTEATVWSSRHLVEPLAASRDAIRPATQSIGRPIANTVIEVVDARGHLQPFGVAGEICIGGAGVARGYLERAALTTERFVADPFADAPGGRLYRTGDLGRWTRDGRLEYLGRNDFQVKLRGFRIELGEVEDGLQHCAGVRESAAAVRLASNGEAVLVAYVVAEVGTRIALADVRRQLASTLPDYMLPGALVRLDGLPRTPNGKLDRAALPAPEATTPDETAFEAPVGAAETALAALWCELFSLPRIGRHANFFDLGGHSLMAVQLVSRVRQAMAVELQLRDLFDAPTLIALAQVLSPAAGSDDDAGIAIAPRDGALPLSFAQQRLWLFEQQQRGDTPIYNMPAAFRVHGALDVGALEAAFAALLARHEVLRTAFVQRDGQLQQRILPPPTSFALRRDDLSAMSEPTRAAAVERACRDEETQAFDLAATPLLRARLLHLSVDEHVLLVTQHHIVSDGVSVQVMVRDMSALYTVLQAGASSPELPALPVQYADYAAWQRGDAQADHMALELAYWRQQLSGIPALLELPLDRPRPATTSHAGAAVDVDFDAGLTDGLRRLARRHACTPAMILMAGFAVLLSRLAQCDDVVIGMPVANRERPEVQDLIGMFLNTLAVRVRLPEDATLEALLEQVRGTMIAAVAHQDVPFEQVVDALAPPRSASHAPVFQVMLTVNKSDGEREIVLPGLRLEPLPLPQETTHFDLHLTLTEYPDRLAGDLQYASALFDRASIVRIEAQLQALMAALVDADASRPVAHLPLLPPAQLHEVLHGLNATARDHDADRVLHAIFEAQAAATPDAPAVAFRDEVITYRRLNARANDLAHRLLDFGARPDDRIALLAERGIDMVVGLLAAWKAGAAYVPIDPRLPRARIAHMLADCAPIAVLTQLDLLDGLPPLEIPVLLLDPDATPPGEPVREDNPATAVRPSNLAYVIYTSGSTGTAKGVMVEHRSAVNFWHVLREVTHAGCPQPARVALNASTSFDMSLKGLLQLLSGHCVVVVPQDIRAEGAAMLDFLRRERIDAVDCTPSQLEGLIAAGLLEPGAAAGNPAGCSVLIGGEALGPAMWQRLRDEGRAAGLRVFNMYGPTEATVDATLCDIAESGPLPTIGRPLANMRIYLLDAQRRPVPRGATGEIWIGGVGVARGYLNRDELTAERFLPDPFSGEPGARMYRSGDLARWRNDGGLEYLGRNDFQVKIRGLRIELGEIEARLAACAGVHSAVVALREERLVAWLTTRDGARPSAAELRTQLLQSLPDYMVPAAFMTLEAFPLNANGKLDRRALPAPDQSAVASRAYDAPLGDVEVALANVWQALLGLDRVGRHDDFFELGGHSLLAVQLVGRIAADMHVELPLRSVFDQPVLANMADAITSLQLASYDAATGDDDPDADLNDLTHEQLLALLGEVKIDG